MSSYAPAAPVVAPPYKGAPARSFKRHRDPQPAPAPARRQLRLDELDELDVLQAWRDRDVNDLDVDEGDDLELLARLREDDDATDWLGV